jgi:hypothetical protein
MFDCWDDVYGDVTSSEDEEDGAVPIKLVG